MTQLYSSLKGVKEYLDLVYENHKENWDTTIAIVGSPGVGKSNLALHMLEYWNTKLYGECKPEDIKHMCLNRKDFVMDLSDCKKREMIIYDEAGEMSSRGAMTKFNREMMIAYQIIRADNIFSVFILPDLWDLDSYFRNKRIKALFYVFGRGRVAYFGGDKLKLLLARNQYKPVKNYWAVSSDFIDTHSIYKGVMQESYSELKQQKVSEFRKGLVDVVLNPKRNITNINDINEMLRKQIAFLELSKIRGVKVAQEMLNIPNTTRRRWEKKNQTI